MDAAGLGHAASSVSTQTHTLDMWRSRLPCCCHPLSHDYFKPIVDTGCKLGLQAVVDVAFLLLLLPLLDKNVLVHSL